VKSDRWHWLFLGLGGCIAVAGLLMLWLIPPGVSISAQDQPTPGRPNLAPPATRTNLTIMAPDFASAVPTAQTNNFDPAQFDLGRRTFTQWCATCHGDHGQGLDKWRSSWDPAHQNCAQSGCHGYRHPPDGFLMLKVAPPLIGPDTLDKFTNAFALYIYMRALMPFQAPGALSDEEYWAVTSFLADQHKADAKGLPLNADNALDVTLP
jgi:mono/diheme cytochrome c family protein